MKRMPTKHTTIFDLYDYPGSSVIILGGPGAGKTTQIYSLAQILLERATTNQTDPLPIVLNLSSWGTTRLPLSLEAWAVEALWQQYKIPLLLDGLDEVQVSGAKTPRLRFIACAGPSAAYGSLLTLRLLSPSLKIRDESCLFMRTSTTCSTG